MTWTTTHQTMALLAVGLLAAAGVAGASEVYRLDFLDDWQTGEAWDTDSAENIAFDPQSQYAFIASAEAAQLRAVDVSDPTALKSSSKLQVGALLDSNCKLTSCMYDHMDFGGGSHPCRYAKMIKTVFDYGSYDTKTGQKYDDFKCGGAANCDGLDVPYSDENTVDRTMDSAAKCQAACQDTVGCEFWSYEHECASNSLTGCISDSDGKEVRFHECFLKAAYTAKKSVDKAEALKKAKADSCNEPSISYSVWESHKFDSKSSVHYRHHAYDKNWKGVSGPVTCGYFVTESIQSVAVTKLEGYGNEIVVAAAPSKLPFADGMLAFFDAKSHDYLGCAPAGNKPEGIASLGGKVACINEGSPREDGALDHHGSMTMCELKYAAGAARKFTPTCTTYIPDASNFAASFLTATKGPGDNAVGLNAGVLRHHGVRLYGPNGDVLSLDLEPEGGAFTADGKFFLIVCQDNNAVLVFDTTAKKYVTITGLGMKTQKMDASDKDDKVNIKDKWGGAKAHALLQPDQVTSFTHGGKYYFMTANEGDTRDGEDMVGMSWQAVHPHDPCGEKPLPSCEEDYKFEGEEIRMGDMPCSDKAVCDKKELGRVLTTGYMPSDLAVHACGTNSCSAKEKERGLKEGFTCVYENMDYGGGGHCGYAKMLKMYVDSMDAHPLWVKEGVTDAFAWPGWYDGAKEVDPKLNKGNADATKVSCDKDEANCVALVSGAEASAKYCQELCAKTDKCDHWTFEFEMGKYECFLKETAAGTKHEASGASCHYYTRYFQVWDDGKWEGFSGPLAANCKVVYSTTPHTDPQHPGTTGGAITIGGRSTTIFQFDPIDHKIKQIYDSGDMMELNSFAAPSGLCDGCDNDANADRCKKNCPFNSDEAPPKLDDRSDAKGPEPECVTTGVMADETRLAFVGLERTGGILTLDVTDPTAAKQTDFLNVRNWMTDFVGKDDPTDEQYVAQGLNDGPESLVFVSAKDSPLGVELLLAVAPMAGRLTVYTITKGAKRTDEGACAKAEGCPYLDKSVGGTKKRKDPCDICKGGKCPNFGCAAKTNTAAIDSALETPPAETGSTAAAYVIGIVIGAVLVAGLFFARNMLKKSATERKADTEVAPA